MSDELDLKLKKEKSKKIQIIISLIIMVILFFAISLFVGSSSMTVIDAFKALLKQSTPTYNRIMWSIRMPRVLAALIAGAGLSVSGLIMQTVLGNQMASPSTLGVSNAAVFGANVSIIVFAGGFLVTGNNINNYLSSANPFQTSLMAFIISFGSILLILLLCKIKNYSPNTTILAGIAIGSIWTAATTILQFYATDVNLSAAVIWNFGDLGRATYRTNLIMFIVVTISSIFFIISSWKYNVLLSGDNFAKSTGININLLRFVSLLLASLITSVCVSFLGIIGFVGIICPHIMKKILGQDHRYLITSSILSGSVLLLLADTLSRSIGSGSALPVGAITSLLGAPFFLYIIFSSIKLSNLRHDRIQLLFWCHFCLVFFHIFI